LLSISELRQAIEKWRTGVKHKGNIMSLGSGPDVEYSFENGFVSFSKLPDIKWEINSLIRELSVKIFSELMKFKKFWGEDMLFDDIMPFYQNLVLKYQN